MSTQGPSKFEEQAAKAGGGVFAEFWIFLKEENATASGAARAEYLKGFELD